MSYWKCSGENYTFELDYYGPAVHGTTLKPKPATFRVDTFLDFLKPSQKSNQPDPIDPDIYVACTICEEDVILPNVVIPPENITIPVALPYEKYVKLERNGTTTIKLKKFDASPEEPGLYECVIKADFDKQKLYFLSGIIYPPTKSDYKDYVIEGRTLAYWG